MSWDVKNTEEAWHQYIPNLMPLLSFYQHCGPQNIQLRRASQAYPTLSLSWPFIAGEETGQRNPFPSQEHGCEWSPGLLPPLSSCS